MSSLVPFFTGHGLLVVFISVLVEQLGLPLPALPFLLMAGALAADDPIFGAHAFLLAVTAAMLADTAWFVAGRVTGRRVLKVLCRISMSPDTCVRQSEARFARFGSGTLVVAKFLPGVSLIARPLAGATGMPLRSFLFFNLAGTLLWAACGIVGGALFHAQIDALLSRLGSLGGTALPVLAALVLAWLGWRYHRRREAARAIVGVSRLDPDALARMIEQGHEPLIIDVRTASPVLPLTPGLPGARHVDLYAIAEWPLDDWPEHLPVVTYCACPEDASAARAAMALRSRGRTVHVLAGGIDAWRAAGYPVVDISTA